MSLEHTKLQQIKRAWDEGKFPLTAEIDWLIAETERLHAELARAKDVLDAAEAYADEYGDLVLDDGTHIEEASLVKTVREWREQAEEG